jgi:hypothetical protein
MRPIEAIGRCRRWVTLAAVATTVAIAPAYAQAQQGEAPASESEVGARLRQMRDHFGPAVSARIDDVLSSARKAGIPEEVLVTKALEGAAKGVPGTRVVQALQAYSERLQRADRLLGGSAKSPVLVAAADALQKGVDPSAVRDVGRVAGADPLPLVVLGDLRDAGVPVGQAVQVVRQAIQQGRHGDQLLDVSAEVRRHIRTGKPPGQAAQEVLRALQGARPPDVPGKGNGHGNPPAARGGGPPGAGGGPPKGPHGSGGG